MKDTSNSSKINILIADDHTLFRSSLVKTISYHTGLYQCHQASNGKEALEYLEKVVMDIVILDVQMPVLDGIQTLKIIRDRDLSVKVLMLTQFQTKALIIHLLNLGANGFLAKNCNVSEFLKALQDINLYGVYNSLEISKALKWKFRQGREAPSLSLSPRELQILKLVILGKSNKMISEHLNLKISTIESYRKELMKKTKTANAAELAVFGMSSGLG